MNDYHSNNANVKHYIILTESIIKETETHHLELMTKAHETLILICICIC